MVVPYGDPDGGWDWRAAFDVGEYGVGRLTSPLEKGRDAPENALLIPADFADDFGAPYEAPAAPIRKRARFLDHHLWATAYRPGELYAAGDFPNQHPGGEGLAKWSDGEPLAGKDLVLWYVLGVTHVPRPEEWPVMPTAKVGFQLAPAGFFARNPSLDVP